MAKSPSMDSWKEYQMLKQKALSGGKVTAVICYGKCVNGDSGVRREVTEPLIYSHKYTYSCPMCHSVKTSVEVEAPKGVRQPTPPLIGIKNVKHCGHCERSAMRRILLEVERLLDRRSFKRIQPDLLKLVEGKHGKTTETVGKK